MSMILYVKMVIYLISWPINLYEQINQSSSGIYKHHQFPSQAPHTILTAHLNSFIRKLPVFCGLICDKSVQWNLCLMEVSCLCGNGFSHFSWQFNFETRNLFVARDFYTSHRYHTHFILYSTRSAFVELRATGQFKSLVDGNVVFVG